MKLLYRLSISTALFAVPLTLFASERLLVQVPAALDSATPVPQAVRSECGLDQLVGNYALDAIAQHVPNAEGAPTIDPADANPALTITILAAHGYGGGGWSGAKSISIKAEFRKGGQSLGTRTFRRRSRGGMFGGVSGTCDILERVAAALGSDVARWLTSGANPLIAPRGEAVQAASSDHANSQGDTDD